MLAELHIEHLGVIERVDVVLGPGMTALTGETGAGKTMLVEALELLVGGRADPTIVRPGAVEARIDGRFVIGDEELVLTRVVPADGRSRAYIDGRPATAGALAGAAAGIVEMHGQHAHQSLLAASTQRDALDQFGEIDLGPLRDARDRLAETEAELATLGGDERARAREIDLLRFQVDELTAAGLDDPDEDSVLDRLEDELADAVGHREAGAAALAALAEEGAGRDVIAGATAALGDRGPFAALAARLQGMLADLDDVTTELRGVAEAIDDDPARLAQVRERRQLLRDLGRKYGQDLPEVIGYRDDAMRRLDELTRFDERAAELDVTRAAAVAAVDRAATAVRAARRATAPRLAAAVTARLRELALPHAEVAVEVGDDGAGDRVVFLFSANPGTPLLPLTKVASGGELARAMLALRLVLTRSGPEQATFVFDEVDAGIGGNAAAAVGEALAEVGQRHQVLVVTHLAQVAAGAATHITVTKTVDGSVTSATADVVADGSRVDEIARMLSGEAGGAAGRQHAEQLLAASRRAGARRR